MPSSRGLVGRLDALNPQVAADVCPVSLKPYTTKVWS